MWWHGHEANDPRKSLTRHQEKETGTHIEPEDGMEGLGSNVIPNYQELGWTTACGIPRDANHLLPRCAIYSTYIY